MICRDCGKKGCGQTLTGTCQACEHELNMKRKVIRRACQERAKDKRRVIRAEKVAKHDKTSPV
jgi:hypothetical protein